MQIAAEVATSLSFFFIASLAQTLTGTMTATTTERDRDKTNDRENRETSDKRQATAG